MSKSKKRKGIRSTVIQHALTGQPLYCTRSSDDYDSSFLGHIDSDFNRGTGNKKPGRLAEDIAFNGGNNFLIIEPTRFYETWEESFRIFTKEFVNEYIFHPDCGGYISQIKSFAIDKVSDFDKYYYDKPYLTRFHSMRADQTYTFDDNALLKSNKPLELNGNPNT